MGDIGVDSSMSGACMTITSNVAKRDFLFRCIPSQTRTNLVLDDESLYSTTDQVTADRITKDILRFVSNMATITDATACIGGTALAFSREFAKVNAIELDDNRYRYLIHNLKTLQTHAGYKNNITCYHGDALEECIRLKQQVIFIDPPWGGPEYRQVAKLSLFLSGVPFSQVCHRFHRHASYLVLKVPTNFDDITFMADTAHFMKIVHKNTALRKMHLLIFKTYNQFQF